MAIQLYDLAGQDDDHRFSPFCWRVKLALAHKGLDYETIPWRFTEKEAIAFSGQGLVPVIRDGETVVHDSWEIARHLDQAYLGRPALFDGPQAEALARFLAGWVGTQIQPLLLRLIIVDLFGCIHQGDRDYFRRTREARLGGPLEQVAMPPDEGLAELGRRLEPLRFTLRERPYLAGERPAFADYVVFGAFMWARCVSVLPLLAEDDPIHAWRERLLDAHGGLARQARIV